jgi:hypothetical protein
MDLMGIFIDKLIRKIPVKSLKTLIPSFLVKA